MDGIALIKALLESTGLPQESLSAEVDRLIAKTGVSKDNFTLDDLRLVMEEYLHSVLPDAQREFRKSS